MPNYEQGKIYSIRSHQTDTIYIGSTVQTLSKRLAKHRNSFKAYKNGSKHYISSFEILEYPDYYIELLELYPCSCKAELAQREGYYIRNNDNCVNKYIAGRTHKQYREDNKETLKQYYGNNKEHIKIKRKQRYEKNREKISERAKEKITCPCGSTIRKADYSRHSKTKKHKNWEKNN